MVAPESPKPEPERWEGEHKGRIPPEPTLYQPGERTPEMIKEWRAYQMSRGNFDP
jgi:hypothetical protein